MNVEIPFQKALSQRRGEAPSRKGAPSPPGALKGFADIVAEAFVSYPSINSVGVPSSVLERGQEREGCAPRLGQERPGPCPGRTLRSGATPASECRVLRGSMGTRAPFGDSL